jgi:peptidyl-prolyl cis-trans isomerase SurA
VGKESGFSPAAVRREIANGIKVNKVSEREVLSRAQASDAEINQLVASGQVKLPEGMNTKMEQYDTRHILIAIDQSTPEPLARKKIAELQARLKAGEAFDSLARTYSQDPGSAANGGSLGWVPAGVMVPEFDKAMMTQPVGIVSPQPVRTVFGYHLVKVDGKRQVEAKEEALRQQAKQMIINQRAGQIYQEMMMQLRKDAHIEVRM